MQVNQKRETRNPTIQLIPYSRRFRVLVGDMNIAPELANAILADPFAYNRLVGFRAGGPYTMGV